MTWDFLQRYDDSWIWRHTDRHEVRESSRNFAALEECMADAKLHGYARTVNAGKKQRETPRRRVSEQ